MIVAVDSSFLFEIIKGGSKAERAQKGLENALSQGVACACEVVFAELGRYFQTTTHLEQFLQACQIDYSALSRPSALTAAGMMRQYALNGGTRQRVVADFLIGAHALNQADALLTLDAGFFREYFAGLQVIEGEL